MARFMWIPKYSDSHKRKKEGFFGRDAYDVNIEPRDMDEAGNIERHSAHESGDCTGVKMVKHVMADPPSTWVPYLDKSGGHWKIVEMEESELQNAHAAVKAGTKSEKAVLRELSHVAAACIAAINAITKK